jgi:glycosyltransferase involved in cell wall biosynthesis
MNDLPATITTKLDRVPVVLTAIVKNEAAVITIGLRSSLPYITHYCICDTGSTDNTKKVITDFFAEHNIPGIICDTPWKNFGHNRTVALQKSREYQPEGFSLMLDADDTLEGELDPLFFEKYRTTGPDGFYITIKQSASKYQRVQVFRNSKPWKYERVLHEYPELKDAVKESIPDTLYMTSNRTGARNADPLKYKRDAELLMEDLMKMPNDPRTLFYIANSWRDYGDKERAKKYYRRRAELKAGWPQENYESYLNLIRLEDNWATRLELAWKGMQIDNRRLEIPYTIMGFARQQKRFDHQVYAMGLSVNNREAHSDFLFAMEECYKWRYDDELAVCAYFTGHHEVAYVMGQRALKSAPEEHKDRIRFNIELSAKHLQLPENGESK